MAKVVEAYMDERGHLHASASNAIIADIAAVLGRIGDEGGLTAGLAKLVIEKRAELEKAFADYDALVLGKGKGKIIEVEEFQRKPRDLHSA